MEKKILECVCGKKYSGPPSLCVHRKKCSIYLEEKIKKLKNSKNVKLLIEEENNSNRSILALENQLKFTDLKMENQNLNLELKDKDIELENQLKIKDLEMENLKLKLELKDKEIENMNLKLELKDKEIKLLAKIQQVPEI
jgi:hypothetical protein